MSQQINLFNPIFRQQKKYFSAVTMAQAIGLILLGAALLTAYAGYRSSRLSAEAAAASMQLKAAQDQLVQADAAFPPRQKSKVLEEQIKKMESEMASLQKVDNLLQAGEFGNTNGHAEYLRAFARQIIEGVWLTGFSIHGAGAEIGLQGRALRPELVPAYINRLKHEPVLQGKSFSALQIQVPQMELTANSANTANTAGAQRRSMAAPYVEFSLQSSDSSAQPANVGGGTVQ
ncbi:PilN domain-containing protein [Janthinobacterium sp. 17J80-10]|uniref:PilN domain-containing protein n=1 Tax=Janthinobacterium sp. 17J80-10 TaxID=2497863 RepID=UPI0010052A89|nr:PilN domain-containing protein [Janthinobacterium sp. 17J80-10]QAU34279.1 MSHA biogenesis protein MshI [Janthinobacterium sp. 17J80-10]